MNKEERIARVDEFLAEVGSLLKRGGLEGNINLIKREYSPVKHVLEQEMTGMEADAIFACFVTACFSYTPFETSLRDKFNKIFKDWLVCTCPEMGQLEEDVRSLTFRKANIAQLSSILELSAVQNTIIKDIGYFEYDLKDNCVVKVICPFIGHIVGHQIAEGKFLILKDVVAAGLYQNK